VVFYRVDECVFCYEVDVVSCVAARAFAVACLDLRFFEEWEDGFADVSAAFLEDF